MAEKMAFKIDNFISEDLSKRVTWNLKSDKSAMKPIANCRLQIEN